MPVNTPERGPGSVPQATGADDRSTLSDRRRFLRLLGAASAAPLAGAILPALGQAPPSPPPSRPPVAPPPPTPPANENPELAPDTQSLLDIVTRHYGTRLDAQQTDAIRADLKDGLETSQRLRKIALANSDEPDVVFRAEPPGV